MAHSYRFPPSSRKKKQDPTRSRSRISTANRLHDFFFIAWSLPLSRSLSLAVQRWVSEFLVSLWNSAGCCRLLSLGSFWHLWVVACSSRSAALLYARAVFEIGATCHVAFVRFRFSLLPPRRAFSLCSQSKKIKVGCYTQPRLILNVFLYIHIYATLSHLKWKTKE